MLTLDEIRLRDAYSRLGELQALKEPSMYALEQITEVRRYIQRESPRRTQAGVSSTGWGDPNWTPENEYRVIRQWIGATRARSHVEHCVALRKACHVE